MCLILSNCCKFDFLHYHPPPNRLGHNMLPTITSTSQPRQLQMQPQVCLAIMSHGQRLELELLYALLKYILMMCALKKGTDGHQPDCFVPQQGSLNPTLTLSNAPALKLNVLLSRDLRQRQGKIPRVLTESYGRAMHRPQPLTVKLLKVILETLTSNRHSSLRINLTY